MDSHLQGLKGAAQHNGKAARVIRFAEGKKRYEVRVEHQTQLLIKPDNSTWKVQGGTHRGEKRRFQAAPP